MSETQNKAADKAAGESKAKGEKEVNPTVAGFARTAKITLLKDKEGNQYGPTNNPKRGGSAATFAKYKDGMTVQQALDAGVKSADLTWDTRHSFISIAG